MKNKKLYPFLLLLIISLFLLFVYPGGVFSFEASYNTYSEQRAKHKDTIAELTRVNQEIRATVEEINDLPDREQKRYPQLEWDLCMPSALVLLEENANYFELELYIDYEDMRNRRGQVNRLELPVAIKGDFEAIRDYLDFLERIDFIALERYRLTPGEGQVVLNILYVE